MTNKDFLKIMRKLPKDATILGEAYDHRSEVKEITYTVTQDGAKYIILKAEQWDLHGAIGVTMNWFLAFLLLFILVFLDDSQ